MWNLELWRGSVNLTLCLTMLKYLARTCPAAYSGLFLDNSSRRALMSLIYPPLLFMLSFRAAKNCTSIDTQSVGLIRLFLSHRPSYNRRSHLEALPQGFALKFRRNKTANIVHSIIRPGSEGTTVVSAMHNVECQRYMFYDIAHFRTVIVQML